LCCAAIAFSLVAAAGADGADGRRPAKSAREGTQDLHVLVVDEKGGFIAGALCTLTGGMLPADGLSVDADAQGKIEFQGILPGSYALTCAAVGYEPVAKTGIELTAATYPSLQIALPAEVVVRQKVEVHARAETAEEQGSAPPAQLKASQIRTLPLGLQWFKTALPLVPGVVRTPNGKISIKGEVENQGLLLVDSAEMVDPVTGAFSIEIPEDAVESLSVFKTTPLADYGRFSGGLTTIETKSPSGRFSYELNDFLPTPRIKSGHIVGIADDEPRLYLTSPLINNKLNFSEAFQYEVDKQPVRGLAYPNNEIKTQGFNSFTSFQYLRSDRQVITVNIDAFPKREQFANIDTLVPQSASSDYGQRGVSAGVIDRYLTSSGGILTSRFQHMEFDSNAHGQGPEPMLVTPDGWGGNFFNKYTRDSNQQDLGEIYQFPKREWMGGHEVRIGVEAVRRSYSGTRTSQPILLERADGTLAERIDFTPAGNLRATDTEIAFFAEDHWTPWPNLAVDYGLRLSGQTVGEPAALAPRLGLVYSPGSSGRTVLRGGVGVFFDRVPLLAGDFTQNPERRVTFFDSAGVALGPPITFQNAYIKTQENGQQIVPSNNRLDSTPHNLTWNLEAEHEFSPAAVLRLSYLSSRTYQEFTVNPLQQPGTPPTMLLSNTGVSRYNELQTTLRLRPTEKADINISYVHSQARGDLNTLAAIYVPFESPVIVPNVFGALPADVPNRLITWSTLRLPREWTLSPVFDVHTGFRYSAVDVYQNYVGVPESQHLPAFASLDLKVTKDLRISFLPWLSSHKVRVGLTVFNLTNHSNPRDVYNNIASPLFGQVAGFQHRFFDASFDILY
jgi:hypothetical protein